MEEVGKLLTCDRCGTSLFIKEKPTNKPTMADGYIEYGNNYEEYDPNWRCVACYPQTPDISSRPYLEKLEIDFEPKMLCPTCREEYKNLMLRFWGDCSVIC